MTNSTEQATDTVVLIQYRGNHNATAFQALASLGAKNGNGMIIVTGQGKMFLYGTPLEVIEMIGSFPEGQSSWADTALGDPDYGSKMIADIRSGLIHGKCTSFRLALPHLQW
jgi:hypothetical protein